MSSALLAGTDGSQTYYQNDNSKCIVTAYGGTYWGPNGPESVDCTATASTCEEASASANRCRDLNICKKVRSYGGEPVPDLNCPPECTIEGPLVWSSALFNLSCS